MKFPNQKILLEAAAKIKLAVFDVDGVLTDGRLILGNNGNEYKCFHVRDGHGLVMLLESGCKVAVITARSSTIVAERMSALGIEYVYQGEQDKGARLHNLIDELGLKPEHVIYVGDDVIDLPAMTKVGLPVAVADAHDEVKNHAAWITKQPGGKGAVREVCELITRRKHRELRGDQHALAGGAPCFEVAMGVCRIGQRIAPVDKRGDRAALQHLEKRTGAGLQRRRRVVLLEEAGAHDPDGLFAAAVSESALRRSARRAAVEHQRAAGAKAGDGGLGGVPADGIVDHGEPLAAGEFGDAGGNLLPPVVDGVAAAVGFGEPALLVAAAAADRRWRPHVRAIGRAASRYRRPPHEPARYRPVARRRSCGSGIPPSCP